MSIEWDSEFQRLENGEVSHPASAELLHWQVNALVEDEPQQVEAWCMLDSKAGSVHFTRNFSASEPGNLTHSIEIFTAPSEGGAGTSVIELEYTPRNTFKYFYNQDVEDTLAAVQDVIDTIKLEGEISAQEIGTLNSLGVLVEAMVLMDDKDLPNDLVVELGHGMVEAINHRADLHTVSSEFFFSNEDEELCAKLQRYIDISFQDPASIDTGGEFELLLTDKKTNTTKHITGDNDQEVLISDNFDVETGLGDYRLATPIEEQEMVKRLASLLHPTLPSRSPEWLSEYSDYLGWSIHQEGPESPYGIAMGVELNHVRSMFVRQFEGINHFIPGSGVSRRVEDTELWFADGNCHPNGMAIAATDLVDFENLVVQKLDGVETHTAIYLSTKFLEPGTVLEGIVASYGAYIEVVVAVEGGKTGKNPMLCGSIALNLSEVSRSDSSFN